MKFPAGFSALNHRDFRLFVSGQLISLIGTWMQTVGQSWLVLLLTNSPFKLGLISTLQWLPMLCFAFVSGAIADRLPKRRLIIGTQTSLMVQAFILGILAWTGHVQYWHVAVLATLYGFATTLDMPARQAFIVEMVEGKGDLMNAIALNSAMFNGARIVGPAIAGLLVARYGVALSFFLNGASFIAVIIALILMQSEGLPRAGKGASVLRDIQTGVRFAVGTPVVALLLSLLLAISLFVINYNVLVPLLAKDVLHRGAQAYGLLMAALGAGAILGALALAVLGTGRIPVAVVVAAAILVCAGTLSISMIRLFWLAMIVLGVIGCAQIIFTASVNTILQVTVPDELRGRIMSLYALVFAGVTPIGSLFVGSVAEAFGTPAAYAIGGGCGLFLVLVLTIRSARRSPGGLLRPQW